MMFVAEFSFLIIFLFQSNKIVVQPNIFVKFTLNNFLRFEN